MLSAIHNRFCFIITIFITTVSWVNAQQASFIYFQSENNLPYQVKWKEQNYPSSSTGYLVIPQVMPGEQSLVIVFSPEIAPEYSFRLTIADKPRGFSIRQSADNKWSLFDMIDFSSVQGNLLVKQPQPVEMDKLVETTPPVIVEKKAAETPAQPVTEKKQVATPIEPVVDKKPIETSSVSVKPVEIPLVKKENSLPKKESVAKPVTIQKIFDKEGSSGIDQVYIVLNGTKSDTVALFIPVLKEDQIKQTPGQLAFQRSAEEIAEIAGIVFIKPALVPSVKRTTNRFQLK